jgi:hypothetical protein
MRTACVGEIIKKSCWQVVGDTEIEQPDGIKPKPVESIGVGETLHVVKPGRAATLIPIVSDAHAASGWRECGHARRVSPIEVLGIGGAESVSSIRGRI